MIVGAGSAEGSSDASNILKPSIARGEIKCVASTTLSEFRRKDFFLFAPPHSRTRFFFSEYLLIILPHPFLKKGVLNRIKL